MTVIDASALAKFILKEEGWRSVVPYLREGTSSVDHVLKEVSNAVWKRWVRGEITRDEAEKMLGALRELADRAVKIYDERFCLDRALELAFELKISVYDSLYIALAEKLGSKLLTSDGRQARASEGLVGVILI